MTAIHFTWAFVAFFTASTICRLWLSSRQIRWVNQHQGQVPAQFSQTISLESHQRAAKYTIAKTQLGFVDLLLGVLLTIAFTLLGGVQYLSDFASSVLPNSPFWRQIFIVLSFVVIGMVIDLPLSWYRQFKLEEKFGFNRMSLGLFFSDQLKGILLGVVIGVPLLSAMLWLMQQTSPWWLWAWLLWTSFTLTMMVIGPSLILPLFNKFEPLPEGPLHDRVKDLLKRCDFASGGLFVMDGSKRSAHGNAFFTGMGKRRRIVLFDTIIEQLSAPEIEAVLAHELGHFKLKHIIKRLIPTLLLSLPVFWLIAYLMQQTWFYQGLGVTASLGTNDHQAVALVLFMLAMPAFSYFFEPLGGLTSRKHEFEADAFAAKHAKASDLINALVKLYKDNASTLTPDPLHSAFYDSHPSASVRIGRLQGK